MKNKNKMDVLVRQFPNYLTYFLKWIGWIIWK